MGKQKFVNRIVIVLFLIFLPISNVKAFGFSFPNVHDPQKERLSKVLEKLCTIRIKINQKYPRFPIPRICKTKVIESPTLEFYAELTSITKGKDTTLNWASDHTLSCEASGGWLGEKTLSGTEIVSPKEDTTYALSCDGVMEGVEKFVTVKVTEPPPPPPPIPTLNLSANSQSINENESAILSWASTDATSCEASGGWDGNKVLSGTETVSPTITTTYTLTCSGAGGGAEGSIEIQVIPLPPPPPSTIDHIVISEVYYHPDSSHGSESSTANEWIELYNDTNTETDVGGWTVGDTTASTDTLPLGTKIPPKSFLVIVNAANTSSFWSIPVEIVVLGSPIGSGLNDPGDMVYLKNGSDVVDQMSYGSNKTVLDLSSLGVQIGHSLSRKSPIVDTDTAADWQDLAVPTPGK